MRNCKVRRVAISVSFFPQHANAVRAKYLELVSLISLGETQQRRPDFQVPERELPCRARARPGTWFARDNVFNFICFCRTIGESSCTREAVNVNKRI